MSNVEDIKRNSRHLRGSIAENLSKGVAIFEEDDSQLIKTHGSYQQDDRDLRIERRKKGEDRAHIFMVRSKVPAGMITAQQYLAHDKIADELGNNTLRVTSRQDFQIHGVLMGNLKSCIQRINESGITTLGACGDVVRNVMATPWPILKPAFDDALQLANAITAAFLPRTNGYAEIWLDGEKVSPEYEMDPIYGEVYLPRKFKIGIAVPPYNDIDVFSNDIALISYIKKGVVEGYSVYAGGGFGMTHNKQDTFPALAQPIGYVSREDIMSVVKAIILTQRDHGNRINRKQARLKYVIHKHGISWFKKEMKKRLDQPVKITKVKNVKWDSVSDLFGWNKQGDGNWFCNIWVPEGRIKDSEEGNYKTAFRHIASELNFPIRLTANCNLLFHDVPANQKEAVNQILKENNIPLPESLSEIRRMGMACVSLPTCGLGLAESERVFQKAIDGIEEVMRDLKIENEQILFRMTGCPNGCARPYNADFAFVGKSPEKYAFYVGGSYRGDRMGILQNKMLSYDDIPSTVRTYLEEFVKNREEGETFTDFWGRTHPQEEVKPEQYHIEHMNDN